MPSRQTLATIAALLLVSFSLWVFPVPVSARSASAVGPTPPRLAFIDREVSFWRSGAEDWTPAQVNTPLSVGDAVFVADAANAEIEIGSRAYVRMGSGTEVQVESLEVGYLQLSVQFGHAAVDLNRLPEGQVVEVDTPNGAFVIDRVGYYRLEVDDEQTTFTTRRDGRARVVPAGGESVDVPSDQQIVLRGTDPATVSGGPAPAEDVWDRWNHDRTAQLGERPLSAAYVPSDVAGLDDLDRYGDWRATPAYGDVWIPRGVPVGWAPYSTGRWVWDGYYGWTWVDYQPWGWAPYHYGRWCWVDGFWGWAPGPLVVRPAYAPALVAFFGGSPVGLSVTVGVPFVSWVALGWGEPVIPWWGPAGFVGRPYWGGWGGPHIVNNVVISNTTIVNAHDIHDFDNFRHRHAVVGVDGDHFGRGGVDYTHVDPDQRRGLRPMYGDPGVHPTRTSLVPREGPAPRPPDRFHARPVVATRAPQDPAQQPHAAGLVPHDARRQAPPRLVPGGSPRVPEPRSERPSEGHYAQPPEIGRGRPVERERAGEVQAVPPGHAESPAARIPGRAPEGQPAREMGGSRLPPPTVPEPPQHGDRMRSNLGKPQQPVAPKESVSDEGRGGMSGGNAVRGGHHGDMGAEPPPPRQQPSAPKGIPAPDAPGKALPSREGATGKGGEGHHGGSRPGFAPGAPPAVVPPAKPGPPGRGEHFGSRGGAQGTPQQGGSVTAPQGNVPGGEGGAPGQGYRGGGH